MKNLTHDRIRSQEVAANVWIAKPEASVTRDDMLKPEYWGHVARHFHAGDTIKSLSSDGTWYAEFVVRSVSDAGVQVGEIKYVEFGVSPSSDPADFAITYRGEGAKWRVTRIADKANMREGFATEADAIAWLALPICERLAA